MATVRALFAGYDAKGDLNLWITDGAAGGTSELQVAGTYFSGLVDPYFPPDFTVLGNEVLFAGNDASGHVNLWETNGSVAGTAELTITGQYVYGLEPSDFTVFGGKAIFAGRDAADHNNLWVTDGTQSGTSELNVAGADSYGLFSSYYPQETIVLGSKVLFEGLDTNDRLNLWVTDGTVAGTSEVQVAAGYSDGLFNNGVSPDFTLFGGKILFAGYDQNREYGLWVTNGTTAGTSELSSSAEYSTGFFNYYTIPDMAVINGHQAVFDGADVIDHVNLWVTDGTSAGTSELMVFGADPSGLFYFNNQSNQQPDFALFGDKVLFRGQDSSGVIGLWSTNGTSAGTTEIIPATADGTGIFYNGTLQVAPDFTVLGTKVLFAGFDANGHVGLWVTNGTAAGTKELVVAGSDPSGLFYNNGPVLDPDFTVIGGAAVFQGFDVNGHADLWVTDGTSAGTRELSIGGADTSGIGPGDFAVLSPPPPSGLALAAGSDTGVKGDGITNLRRPAITGTGVTGDKVTLYDGTKAIGTATVTAAGTWSITPASALTPGVHSLTATQNSAVFGDSAASTALTLTIKTSAPAPSGLSFAAAADKGIAGDTVTVAGKGEADDTVTLFDGTTAIGSIVVGAAGNWSITTAKPLGVGAHSLSTREVDVAGNTSAASPAQSVTISQANPNNVTFVGTPAADNFTGGAGNDIFRFTAANLTATDIVKGGGGTDYLEMTTAGTILAGGVSGVEIFDLANAGANHLTLANANFAGVASRSISVHGGTDGNTIDASAVTAPNQVIVYGGAGNDIFDAGGDTTMTGGAGTNEFVFKTAGNNTIADFAKSSTNEIVFSNSGFALGQNGPGSAPKALPAGLFVADKTGTFTATNQRFAYGTSNGELFYSASGTTATEHLVAKLTGDPTLTAAHLFFIT